MRSAEDQVVEDEVGFQDDEVYIEKEENTEFTELSISADKIRSFSVSMTVC